MSHSETHIFQTATLSKKGRGLTLDKETEVIGALPGEEVEAALGPRSKGKRLAYLRDVVQPSLSRVSPRCPHAPKCGGCSLQQMDYSAQLDWKEAEVHSLFSKWIDKGADFRPIRGCTDPWRYRNKMEFSFSQNKEGDRFLGLMLAGSRGRVENLSECHLVSTWYMELLTAVRTWWEERPNLEAYFHRADRGHLRCLVVREAKKGTGKMVILTVSGNPDYALPKEAMTSFVEVVKQTADDPDLSIFLRIQQIQKGRETQLFEMRLHGPDHITEQLTVRRGSVSQMLQFKISPTSFFQPNTSQAEELYSEALELVFLEGARVFDLYCGGATIGIAAARFAKEVIGIELHPHSVFDAGWNKEVNSASNVTIHKGDVGKVLSTLMEDPSFAPPDVAIVDPPRCGLDAKAIENLITLAPKEILYISCNPRTQAENIEVLVAAGYTCSVIQPIDQFPHTVHIENIAVLTAGKQKT